MFIKAFLIIKSEWVYIIISFKSLADRYTVKKKKKL